MMIRRIRKSMVAKEAGFTLAEMGVIIIIIGTLSAIALPILISQRKKGVDATLKTDLKIAANASTGWLVDNPLAFGPTTTSTDAGMTVLLSTYGFRKSPGNSVYVLTKPNVGYCLFAYDPASKQYTTLATSMLYDSAAGGIIDRANVPITGACAA